MADDHSKGCSMGRVRIDVNRDYEVRHWSERFGVTPDELRQAVQRVGPIPHDVEGILQGHGKRAARKAG